MSRRKLLTDVKKSVNMKQVINMKKIHIFNPAAEKFKKYLIYRKCTSAKIENINNICSDGEIIKTDKAEISIVKNTLFYLKTKKPDLIKSDSKFILNFL